MTKANAKILEKKLNAALYAAAEKAGFRGDLARAQVEIYVYADNSVAHIVWDAELSEDERFVFPKEAWTRAKAWLTKAAAREGLRVIG